MKTTMRRLFLTAGIAGIIGLALPETPGAGASTGQTVGRPTEVVMQLTGADSPNRTDRWDVYGTDLGHMFLYKGQLRYAFGDTFGKGRPLVGPGGTNHRDNTMARSTDTNSVGGLVFKDYVSDPFGNAKELFDDNTVASVIPTNGIAIGERMFLHYMAVRNWGPPGSWDVAFSGLAYSDDGGQTWTMDPKIKWGDHSNFAQVAMLRDGGYVYLFGIPEGRFGGVKLARVRERSLLNRGSYRYWTGFGWARDERIATTIVPPPVGELSVRWSGRYNRWLMTSLNDANQSKYGGHDAIVLRSSKRLTGRWSDELVLTTSADYPLPYAPYQVPTQPDGNDLYYNMSRYDEYNVFLMRTTLPDRLP